MSWAIGLYLLCSVIWIVAIGANWWTARSQARTVKEWQAACEAYKKVALVNAETATAYSRYVHGDAPLPDRLYIITPEEDAA